VAADRVGEEPERLVVEVGGAAARGWARSRGSAPRARLGAVAGVGAVRSASRPLPVNLRMLLSIQAGCPVVALPWGLEDEGRVVQERQRRRRSMTVGRPSAHPALPIRHRDHPARPSSTRGAPWNLFRPGEKKRDEATCGLCAAPIRLAASRTPHRSTGRTVRSTPPRSLTSHRATAGVSLLAGPAESHCDPAER